MPNAMKCPLCASPLSTVGKKGRKMRCEACRSVFDVSQLHEFYGVSTPDESGSAAHEYETSHMHAVEAEHRRQQASQQMFQQAGAPVPEPTRAAMSAMPSNQAPQTSPTQNVVRQGIQQTGSADGKPQSKGSKWVPIAIIVVIVWLLPELIAMLNIFAEGAANFFSTHPL